MWLFTDFLEGDIGHVPDELLVLGDVLRPGDDGVGDVAVPAPADEGLPVLVQPAGVHLPTHLVALVQDHLGEVRKANAPIVCLEILDSVGVPPIRLVNNFVLKC